MLEVEINGRIFVIPDDLDGREYRIVDIEELPRPGYQVRRTYIFRGRQPVEVRTAPILLGVSAPDEQELRFEPASSPEDDVTLVPFEEFEPARATREKRESAFLGKIGKDMPHYKPYKSYYDYGPGKPAGRKEKELKGLGAEYVRKIKQHQAHAKMVEEYDRAKMKAKMDMAGLNELPDPPKKLELDSVTNPSVRAYLEVQPTLPYKIIESRLQVGDRVYVELPGRVQSATVIHEMKDQAVLVCLDDVLKGLQPRKRLGRKPIAIGQICGIDPRVTLVQKKSIHYFLHDILHQDKVYEDLPPQICVTPRSSLSSDGQPVPMGAIGRPIAYEVRMGGFIVQWLNWNAKISFPYVTATGMRVPNCLGIPRQDLLWCNFDPAAKAFNYVWPCQAGDPELIQSPYEAGSYVVYRGKKPLLLPAVSNKSSHSRALGRGFVLKYAKMDPKRGPDSHQVTIPQTPITEPGLVGYTLSVRTRDLEPLEATYFEAQAHVEVTANVVFRKKSLQGRRAQVILPTDGDGDVGVEFAEDLGAGSLDGLGKHGRCLYIPASALKVVSVP